MNLKKIIFKNSKKGSFIWSSLGVWLLVIVMFIILTISTKTFFTSTNVINLVRQVSVSAMVALGTAFVVFGGEIDLSTGAILALGGVICSKFMVEAGWSIPMSIIVTVLIGMVIGLVNGTIVTTFGLNSFIVTLGMQYVLQGISLLLTNSQPVSDLPKSFLILGRGYLGPIPIPVIITAIMFIIGAFVFRYLPFGRYVIAVGDNPIAANLSGISVRLTKITMFLMNGAIASLGAIILASRLSSGQPTVGADVSMQALAAVYVGGTSQGKVSNTLGGVLVLGLVNNGLNLLRVNVYWQRVALGIIIIASVVIDTIRTRSLSSKKD